VLRWKDPIENRYRDQTLGEVTKAQATDAAIAKKSAIDAVKIRFLTGELVSAPTGSDPIEAFISSADTKGTAGVRHLAAKHLRKLQVTMGARGWNELQRSDLLRLNHIITSEKSLRGTTINLRLKTCRRFFNGLLDQGLLGSATRELISRSIKLVKAPESKHGKILTRLELQDAFSTMLLTRVDIALFFLLNVLIGCRIQELVQIKGSDVVIRPGVKPHLIIHATKTNKTRKINLSVSPLAAQILTSLSATNQGFIFFPTATKERDPVGLYKKFSKPLTTTISRKTGTKITAKDFRSTSEALLANLKGWDIFRVSKQIGHSVTIAERSYTEDIQMVDFPEGSTIEDVAGINQVGRLILKANNLYPSSREERKARSQHTIDSTQREAINQDRIDAYLKDHPEHVDVSEDKRLRLRLQDMAQDIIDRRNKEEDID
jgi:integrase